MTEREEYESGLSLRIIAILRGVAHETIRRRIRKQGGTMRPRGTNI